MMNPPHPTTALPGRPPVADRATWQAARDELLVREKAHTRAGDALAAERRRLPMVEFDGRVEVVGSDGPVPFLDLFRGRDELVVYKHMWHDGAPHNGQCGGCTANAWQQKDAVYLNARGISYAVLTVPVLVRGRGRKRHLGPYEPPRAAVDPPRGDTGHLTSVTPRT